MPSKSPLFARFQISLAFVLFTILFATLWLAGGASRGDVLGQVVVRFVAWGVIVAFVLFGKRVSPMPQPLVWLMAAVLALPLLQLVPLPPAVWEMLPGRTLFLKAAEVSGQAQPWRPWSLVPGATMNAAASLVVPIAVLLLASGMRTDERRWLPGMMLLLIILSGLAGLVQFTGIGLRNPFINDTPGEVAGMFANRNHFAVFLSLGCLIVPIWGFPSGRAAGWRAPVSAGVLLLLLLTILASGSRAGIFVGGLGTAIGTALAWPGIGRTLGRYPRWVSWTLVIGVAAIIAGTIMLSMMAGRAISIDRTLVVDGETDMRVRSLPVVWTMIYNHFSVGSGFGGFDNLFRVYEPSTLLKLTYFNHAHNDWLEIVLDGGLPATALMLFAVLWWCRASMRAWRVAPQRSRVTPRLGSAMILLIMIASAFDYPARTPMIMAVMMVAAIWLFTPSEPQALPTADQHL